MQVTETLSEGLKRELKVVVPADELKTKAQIKLEDLKGSVRINGFRPGKVPLERVRQMFGRKVMIEVVEETVGATSTKALQDRNERPALQPEIKLPEGEKEVERLISGAADLEFTMSFEVLPKIELADLRSITVEKEIATPSEEDVAKALNQLLQSHVTYEPSDKAAEKGDRLKIDYAGSIDGSPLQGGAAENVDLVLGESGFVPGFEEGLEGAKAGEERQVTVTFPADYTVQDLAGKEAAFAVTVKEVGVRRTGQLDDEFAQGLGFDSLEKLKEAVVEQLQKGIDLATKSRLKKHLLDALDERHTFELPPSLVKSEFDSLWSDIAVRLCRAESSFEAQGTTEEEARAECMKLAERRVRLGLILAEIGTANQLHVTEEDISRAVVERARRFPGQERAVISFYRENPEALNSLRAPVYEEKVVNFALELVKQSEKPMTSAELTRLVREDESENAKFLGGGLDEGLEGDHNDGDDHDHHHDHNHVHGPGCDHDH